MEAKITRITYIQTHEKVDWIKSLYFFQACLAYSFFGLVIVFKRLIFGIKVSTFSSTQSVRQSIVYDLCYCTVIQHFV